MTETFVPDHPFTPDRDVVVKQLFVEIDDLIGELDAILKPIRKLRRKQETLLLETLATGAELARGHARAVKRSASDGIWGDVIASLVLLTTSLRDVGHSDNMDEILRESADAQNAPLPSLLRWWSETETGLDRVAGYNDRLNELLVALSHATETEGGVKMDETTDATAEAVRDLGITIAAMMNGGAATAPSRGAGRFDKVSDQMVASLDALGLPHDGVALARGENDDFARARLLDGLQRNFGSKVHEGSRRYFRTATTSGSGNPIGTAKLLRGSALVNANLLQAEADAVNGIIDRLVPMIRFQLANPVSGGAVGARAAIRAELTNIVETASDPMGLNRARAEFQFFRLVLAVLDYLDSAELMPRAPRPDRDKRRIGSIMTWLGQFRDDEVCAESSVVRDEEVRSEIANLIDLLISIAVRLSSRRPDEERGLAAARLEEALTAALGTADVLEIELVRAGTDLIEQDIDTVTDDDDDDSGDRLSIGQFVRWVRAVAGPFSTADHRAASLRAPELRVLAEELGELDRVAAKIGQATPVLAFGRSVPRHIVRELSGYLTIAHEEADRLAGGFAVVPAAGAPASPPAGPVAGKD